MHVSTSLLLSVYLHLLLLPTTSAHGFLQTITTPSQTYPCWSPHTDSHKSPPPKRYTRRYATNGPVPDFTSPDIACNVGGNAPISEYIDVKAGDKLTFQWDTWPSSLKGPIMTYLLPCPSSCSSLTLPTKLPWYKIHQSSYTPSNDLWGTDHLLANNLTHTLTLPTTLPRGEYLLRHEILALHEGGREGGAQFYPSCAQIRVESGVDEGWEGYEGMRFPGGYEKDGEGILFGIYGDGLKGGYKAPGGEVVKLKGDRAVQDEVPLEGRPVVEEAGNGGGSGRNGGGDGRNGGNGGNGGNGENTVNHGGSNGGNTNSGSGDYISELERLGGKAPPMGTFGSGVVLSATRHTGYGVVSAAVLIAFFIQ